MLKLEKSASNRQINVIIRNSDHLCTQAFTYSLCIAIAFHLFFFILFQVVPFNLSLKNFQFPPIHVEIEPFSKDAEVLSETMPVPWLASGLPQRSFTSPPIPSTPSFLTESFSYFSETNRENPFVSLEKEIYYPHFKLPSKKPAPIKIIISGALADLSLVKNGLEVHPLPSISPSWPSEIHLTYHVLVEGKKGQIVWFEAEHSESIPELKVFVEKILSTILFTPHPQSFILQGSVEFEFRFFPERKYD